MIFRYALLIASSEFDDQKLKKLTTPSGDAESLANVLGNRAIGAFHVDTLINEDSRTVRKAIEKFYKGRKRDDLLVLYYSGHGIRDDYGDLYLTTSDTEVGFPSATALETGFVRNLLDKCASQRKVVILDCCYSGAFGRSKDVIGSNAGTKEAFEGNGYGRVILTATNAVQYAWEESEFSGDDDKSVFTSCMVQGLESGDADEDNDGYISLGELYQFTHDKMRSEGAKQTPQLWAQSIEGKIYLARNPNSQVPYLDVLVEGEKYDRPSFDKKILNRLLRQVPETVEKNLGYLNNNVVEITRGLLREIFKQIREGVNLNHLEQGLEQALNYACDHIKKGSILPSTKEEILNIGYTFVYDRETADLIIDLLTEVGPEGRILVEHGESWGTETEIRTGFKLNNGYLSPYFVTDPENMVSEVEEPLVFVCQDKLTAADDIVPVLETLKSSGERDIVILAQDVNDEAMATLVLNKLRGIINVLAIKAPDYGIYRTAVMEFIAMITGTKVYSTKNGNPLKDIAVSDLGAAEKIRATKSDTIILGDFEDTYKIFKKFEYHLVEENIKYLVRVESIKEEMDQLVQHLKRSLCKVAIVRVGVKSEIAHQSKTRQLKEAIEVMKAAIEEGIVPGGGTALICAQRYLGEIKADIRHERMGLDIMMKVLELPMKVTGERGGKDGAIVITETRRLQEERENPNIGYDAISDDYVDMVESGIIEPTNRVCEELRSAFDVAIGILYSEVWTANRYEQLRNVIVKEGFKVISKGVKSIELETGLGKALTWVCENIRGQSTEYAGREKIFSQVFSFLHDQKIADLVVDILEMVGKHGNIVVQEGEASKIEVEMVDGLQLEWGYLSPYFVTDEEYLIAEIENPNILISDDNIKDAAELVPLLEKLVEEGKRDLVLFADVEGEALSTLVLNKMRGMLNVAVIKPAGHKLYRQMLLNDIATLTNTRVFSRKAPQALENIGISDLGVCEKITITNNDTKIVGLPGAAVTRQELINQVEQKMDSDDVSKDEKAWYKDRLERLSAKTVVLKVGGKTEVERSRRTRQIAEAIESTQAALEGGIVPGGGVALINALKQLNEIKTNMRHERIGLDIMIKALELPMRVIAERGGRDGPDVVAEVLRLMEENKNPSIGYDALSDNYVDMIEIGNIEPTSLVIKSVKEAVQDAITEISKAPK
jgi:chaperonin GroEL